MRRYWCANCDRMFDRDTHRNCPHCGGRGKGADFTRAKVAAFRRARQISNLILARFRPVKGADIGDWWAPDRRDESAYMGIWMPITDAECNEALNNAAYIEVINGRLVAFYGRGWNVMGKYAAKHVNSLTTIRMREQRLDSMNDARWAFE